MRDRRRFRPCLDLLPSRIAPSTVALASTPTYGTASEPPPSSPPSMFMACTDDPMTPTQPTSVGG